LECGIGATPGLGKRGDMENESKTEFTESKACSRPGAKDLELNKVNFWTSYCSDDPYLEAKIGKILKVIADLGKLRTNSVKYMSTC
jgi:hypothetical protein